MGPVALVLLFGLTAAAPETAAACIPHSAAPGPELQSRILETVPQRGTDIARLRRLHAALVDAGGPDGTGEGFAVSFVALAREAGIPAYFVLVDRRQSATGDTGVSLMLTRLAAGYGHDGRVVVFDTSGIDRPKHRHVQVLTDLRAAAIRHRNAGLALLERGALDAAIDRFEAAVRLDPDMGTAWSALGSALREVGHSSAALDAYERSIALAYAR